MKRGKGFTIIEALIGITYLLVILGSVLGAFEVIQRHFNDGIALVNSQATARKVIEKIVRATIREGSSFSPPPPDGNTLTVTKYDGSVHTFTFNNGDGDDATFADNTLEKNGNTIGINIIKIPGESIFQDLEANERVAINFGVRNQGRFGTDKEVRISTEMKLRN